LTKSRSHFFPEHVSPYGDIDRDGLTICGGRGAEEKNYERKLLHGEPVTMM
jgi:hypothetical protein